jgi:hypothetical protein
VPGDLAEGIATPVRLPYSARRGRGGQRAPQASPHGRDSPGESMRLAFGLLLLCHLSKDRKKPTGRGTRWTSTRLTNSSREPAKRLPQLFRPSSGSRPVRPKLPHSQRSKPRRCDRSDHFLSGSRGGCRQWTSCQKLLDGRGTKLGGRNEQSDKHAAQAAAFAERMRPVMAELQALSANRTAIVLHKAASQRQQVASGPRCRWSGCARVSTGSPCGNRKRGRRHDHNHRRGQCGGRCRVG